MKKLKKSALGVCTIIASVIVTSIAFAWQTDSESQRTPSQILDTLHEAAAKADGERYFSLFAPDAVFLGTDATERWPISEFKPYAMKRFETGTGWTYTLRPGTRHIAVHNDIAWFDELLDNAKYGQCRGSGVLRNIDGAWKIAQYNLTILIPNDLALEFAERIRQHNEAQK